MAAIQEITSIEGWRHIDGKLNPADIVSRGIYPSDLLKSDIWFNGPLFFKDSKEDWPKSKVEYTDYKDEIKPLALTYLMLNENSNCIFNDIKHYDSYKRLQRIIDFILKFRYSFSKRIHKADILYKAEIIVIKLIQSKFNIASKINNDLVSLTPFIDSDNIIRVGGRLQNSAIPFDFKHPILLPNVNYLNH